MKNEEMARLFSEATPYIQKYHGKTMVVKYGGNAMINEELKNAVMNDLVTLTLLGVRVVLVHGGGPEISSMLKKIGTAARIEIENLMDAKVNLQLWVKVRREWRDSELYMKNYGYNPRDI